MDAFHAMPLILSHHLCKIINTTLSFTEDQHFAVADGTKVRNQTNSIKVEYLPLVLVFIVNKFKCLLDTNVSLDALRVADLDVHRKDIAVRASKVLHFLGPCCTPHESLAIRSNLAQNFLDMRFKAHVL